MASSGPGAAPGLDYKDYYAVLGVPRTASQAEIKKAFRKLARQHHPDAKPGDTAAERRFKEVNEANEVLGDPAKRKQYDELGANWEAISRARQAGAAGGAAARSPASGATPAATSATSSTRPATPASSRDFFRVFFGEEAMGSAGGSPASGGRGIPADRRPRLRRHPGRDGASTAERPGPAAAGPVAPVAAARATRRRPRSAWPRRTTARPAWSRSTASAWRSRSRRAPTPGRGSSCPAGTRRRRPVRRRPAAARRPVHPPRRRPRARAAADPRGGAARRARSRCETLKGSVLLTIPPGTQPGRTFRLTGQGMPRFKAAGHGDLYVKARVVLPTGLSDEAAAAARSLLRPRQPTRPTLTQLTNREARPTCNSNDSPRRPRRPSSPPRPPPSGSTARSSTPSTSSSALVEPDDGVPAETLRRLGVDLPGFRGELAAILARRARIQGGSLTLDPRARRVIEPAEAEARRLGDEYVSTEHLLLARRRGRRRGPGPARAPCGRPRGHPPGAPERARRPARHLAEPRGHLCRAREVRPRPDRRGARRQARPGDRPRRGDPPGHPGPLAADQEQPGPDRRARRGQDGDRRGPRPADRPRRRPGGAQGQARRVARPRRADRRGQVPRRVRGAAEGRAQGDQGRRGPGHPVHRRAPHGRRRRRGGRARWTPRTCSSRCSRAASCTRSARRRSTSTASTSRRTPPSSGASSRSSSTSRRSRRRSRILRGLRERYEVHHGVRITDSALVAAATLSDRYITRPLPARQGDRPRRRGRVAAAHGDRFDADRARRARAPADPARDRARGAAQGDATTPRRRGSRRSRRSWPTSRSRPAR